MENIASGYRNIQLEYMLVIDKQIFTPKSAK